MVDLIIGMFLSVMAQFIHNPSTAAKYIAELNHIQNGIDAVKVALQPKADSTKS